MRMYRENDELIVVALKEAAELHNTYLGSEHLLLAILKNDKLAITQLLHTYGIRYHTVRNDILSLNYHCGLYAKQNGYSPVVQKILSNSEDSTSLLLAMLKESDCLGTCILNQYNFEKECMMH